MKYLELDGVRAALALSVSLLFHLALLAVLRPGIPAGTGYRSTIKIELVAPSDASGQNHTGDATKDITDSSPAWSGKTSTSRPVRQPVQRRQNLDWMSDYFSGAPSTRRPSTAAKASDGQDIEAILSASPTTGTPYWQFLVRHLAQSRYFDKQYDFSQLKQERTVILELKISPNGFMERARVRLSSGDRALDQAAIRSAYAANPFKPPPAEDAASGYTYLVKITYTPKAPGQ